MLGRDITDCLPNADADNVEGGGVKAKIQIGEGLNGAVLIRNMTTHICSDANHFGLLIQRANATRFTAVTAKNETSSRSHGIAIVKVTNKKTGVEGSLYVIDLAGSESAMDSKCHDTARMKETKEINSSLMTLKSCIRARTTAAAAGQGSTHIPYRSNKLTLLMKVRYLLMPCGDDCIFTASIFQLTALTLLSLLQSRIYLISDARGCALLS